MPDHNLHLDIIVAAAMSRPAVPPPLAGQGDCRLASEQFLAPLRPAVASWHRRSQHGANQVIIRFHNGYGAIISEYRLLEGIYEIAPLKFHGPGPDDHGFYFRSHVSDLTWCSHYDEMVGVCEQISRLLPAATV